MEIFIALRGVVIIVVTSQLLSYAILSPELKLPFPLRISLSIILLSLLISFLGFIHLLRPEFIYLVYTLIMAVSIITIYARKKVKTNIFSEIKNNIYSLTITPLFLILFIYFIVIFLNTLTPPISRDALNYHLFLPRMWLSRGKIITLPQNLYSFFPGYWECFLSSALVIGNDITAKLFHFLYLVFLCFLLHYFLKEFSAHKWTDLLCVIFIATPTINKIATWAYLDLTFCFYILSGLYLLIIYNREGKKIYFWLSAIFVGYTMGMKYLGLVWLICLLPFFAYHNKTFKSLIIQYTKYSALAAIIACPFYIRNWIVTGNPLFPFLSDIFKSPLLSPEKYQLLMLYFNSYGKGKSFLDLILLPFHLLFTAGFKTPQGFDGKLNLLYALGLLLFLNKKSKINKLPPYIVTIFLAYILFWFYLSQQMRFLIPGLFLLVVIYGLCFLESWKKYLLWVVGISSLFYLKYPLEDFLVHKPYRYIVNRENREQFLARNFKIFPFLNHINMTLTPNDKIMLLDMGAIGYYLTIPIYQETIFEDYTFKNNLNDLEQLKSFLKKEKITHILIDVAFINKYLLPTLDEKKRLNLELFIRNYLRLVDKYHNWYLFKLTF